MRGAFRSSWGPRCSRRSLSARLSSDASLLFSGEWIWLPKQPILASYQVTGGLRWRFTQALALSVTGAFQNAGIDGQLGLFVYY